MRGWPFAGGDLLTRFGAARCVLLRASMPTASFLSASTGPLRFVFKPKLCPLGGLSPGFKGLGPCRVDRTSSRDGFRDGESGSSSPFFWVALQQRVVDFAPALSWRWLRWRLVRALALSWRRLDFTSTHGLVLCQGYQRLEVGIDGFLSLASGFDAGAILSQGWCSACDQQCSPSFVCVDARGLDFPRVHLLGCASESETGLGQDR